MDQGKNAQVGCPEAQVGQHRGLRRGRVRYCKKSHTLSSLPPNLGGNDLWAAVGTKTCARQVGEFKGKVGADIVICCRVLPVPLGGQEVDKTPGCNHILLLLEHIHQNCERNKRQIFTPHRLGYTSPSSPSHVFPAGLSRCDGSLL